MAYSFTATSSQSLSTTSSPLTIHPLTMSCWFYNSDVPVNRCCMSVGNSAATSFHSIILNLTSRSVSCITNVSGTVASANNGGTDSYSFNTWNHLCGVINSSTTRNVFLNGINVGSNTSVALTPTGLNSVTVGGRWSSGNIGQLYTGRLAEAAVWNTALTSDEIASLADGISCYLVRPQSLVFYAPIVRNLVDVRGGLTITNNNGATVTDHPRIYY